jgi:hypothetical protein
MPAFFCLIMLARSINICDNSFAQKESLMAGAMTAADFVNTIHTMEPRDFKEFLAGHAFSATNLIYEVFRYHYSRHRTAGLIFVSRDFDKSTLDIKDKQLFVMDDYQMPVIAGAPIKYLSVHDKTPDLHSLPANSLALMMPKPAEYDDELAELASLDSFEAFDLTEAPLAAPVELPPEPDHIWPGILADGTTVEINLQAPCRRPPTPAADPTSRIFAQHSLESAASTVYPAPPPGGYYAMVLGDKRIGFIHGMARYQTAQPATSRSLSKSSDDATYLSSDSEPESPDK